MNSFVEALTTLYQTYPEAGSQVLLKQLDPADKQHLETHGFTISEVDTVGGEVLYQIDVSKGSWLTARVKDKSLLH